jgi:cation diffusion facilitator family transporter
VEERRVTSTTEPNLARPHVCAATRGGERRTLVVVVITAAVMVVEIAAGIAYGSMALLADGWHMGTHAAALAIAVVAYRYTRRHAADPAYAFGPGKVNVLAGYTSALILAVVALAMAVESVHRLVAPRAIQYGDALAVAALGLVVNLACALVLRDDTGHGHEHDHNLRGAYLHVLADAVTSILAIGALAAGKLAGAAWLDPAIGIAGAALITHWAIGLARDTSAILLDKSGSAEERSRIRAALEAGGDSVIELRVWRICSRHVSVAAVIESSSPRAPDHYRAIIERASPSALVVVELRQAARADAGCPDPAAAVESSP